MRRRDIQYSLDLVPSPQSSQFNLALVLEEERPAAGLRMETRSPIGGPTGKRLFHVYGFWYCLMLRYLSQALTCTTGYWYSSIVLYIPTILTRHSRISMGGGGGSVAKAHSPSPTALHEPWFQLVHRLAIQELEDKSQGIFLFLSLQFEY